MVDAPPPLILSYYDLAHHARLVEAVERAGLPDDTPVYFGTYHGLRARVRKPKPPPPPAARPPMPNGSYAPMFSLQRSTYWRRRRLPPADRKVVGARMSGRIPPLRRLIKGSGGARRKWGVELGRRFRDATRNRSRYGQRIRIWQFDEIKSEVATRQGGPWRQLTAAVLHGLYQGRPRLHDPRQRGIVWMAGRAFAIARGSARGGLGGFWRTVDRTSLYLVGEEYPPFVGSPLRAASRYGAWQRALRRAGGSRRRLASRYVVGITPGMRLRPGLGGNVRRRPLAAVAEWRDAYVSHRSRGGAAGFAAFNLIGANARRRVLDDVVAAMGGGVRALR